MSAFCFSLPNDICPPSRVNAARESSSVAGDTTTDGKESQPTDVVFFVRSHIIYDRHPIFCACVVVLVVGERNDVVLSVNRVHPAVRRCTDSGRKHCAYTECRLNFSVTSRSLQTAHCWANAGCLVDCVHTLGAICGIINRLVYGKVGHVRAGIMGYNQ